MRRPACRLPPPQRSMSAPALAATKPPSTFEDIVDVFYAPAAVFERRRHAGFGLALLLYILVSTAMLYAARPIMRPVMEQQMNKAIEKMQASNPSLSQEQKDAAASRMKGMVDSPFALVAPAIMLPVSLFLVALALWIGGKVVGSSASYGQAMMVTTFSAFPRLLLTVLVTAFSLATGREMTSQYGLGLNPVSLMPTASPMVAAALSRLDVGVLWMTALLGIGIAVVGKVPRAKGMVAAVLVWVVASIIMLGSVAMQG